MATGRNACQRLAWWNLNGTPLPYPRKCVLETVQEKAALTEGPQSVKNRWNTALAKKARHWVLHALERLGENACEVQGGKNRNT